MMQLSDRFTKTIISATAAKSIQTHELIQSLWGGYGKLFRVTLGGSAYQTVVVKHVRLPKKEKKDISHLRKIRSYEVETAFYKHWSHRCQEDCRIPICLATDAQSDEVLLVLEDLDAAGFYSRRSQISFKEIITCVRWLANFHATFMNEKPSHLWKIGTYWHLATRPEEIAALKDKPLKDAAAAIDSVLNACRFTTFVHGDAKLANFCFSKDGGQVAAVDFQYVGGGCGMKDLAYLMDSCLQGKECERYEQQILQIYFESLRQALKQQKKELDTDALEAEWRAMYAYAWADFYRFLKGWSYEYWGGTGYSEKLCKDVIQQLKK